MSTSRIALSAIDSFGDVAAEDDSVLNYFVTTDAVDQLVKCEKYLVLGRKGSGKTALVRYFSETPHLPTPARALKLRSYPWNVHALRKDSGASDIEAYTASWRYLIACELAMLLLEMTPSAPISKDAKVLSKFFSDNYGTSQPSLDQIIRPKRIQLSKGSLEPTVLGNKLGSISFERAAGDHDFGLELNALSNAILAAAMRLAELRGEPTLLLHFDELDQGLSELDKQRKEMLTGLILAARDIRHEAAAGYCRINPVVYLRTDIWDALEFSDKNKITQTAALHLEWTSESLEQLINRRIQSKSENKATWEDLDDQTLMRGSQTKWNHILARTFLRPRDVIRFLNAALDVAKDRDPEVERFINEDITGARDAYSRYLKEELDDEITPHWKNWSRAIRTLATISTITFDKESFEREYEGHRADGDLSFEEVLEILYRFSVIGYERRSGYGGSGWAFQYANPEAGWDKAATRYKVHLGLKEFAKLREERA